MKILHFPLARISICFFTGILIAHYFKPTPFFAFGLLAILMTTLVILYFVGKKNAIKNFYFGIATALVAMQIGVSTQVIHNQTFNKNHYTHQISNFEKEHILTLVIKEKLKSTTLNQRYIASVKTVDGRKSFGKIILNLRKEIAIKEFAIGENLKIKGSIYKNRGPINPNQFDYGHYLENQQIYAQIYTAANKVETGKIEHNLWNNIAQVRTKIIRNLEKANFPKEELSVVIALILGQQQDISPEVLKDYQFAGAVHILSVSGLHVGFILLFISFLLKPIPNTKLGANTKVVLVIISLWLFGILAGLSPSVLRSVTMFSFVALGMHLRRTVNIYHTLLVSALLILLFEPSFLFAVGFQLSYIALFFIVWFQPILVTIWHPKNKITHYFWEIITVSCAAQIGTFPLSVYYFHQFPGLFFVTNIVIIPLLSVILAIGVLVIILAAFDYVPMYLAKALEWSIIILNKIIHWVASFENLVFQNISFSIWLLATCYLIIFSCIVWLKNPNFKKTVVVLLAILSFQFVFFLTDYSAKTKEENFIFNIKKGTIITQRKGNQVTVYSNDTIFENITNNLAIKSYLVENFCEIKEKKLLKNTLYLNHKKIFVLDSSAVYNTSMQPDILIITQSPKLNFERLLQILKPKQVIFDGSNFKTYSKRWEATCKKQKIPFHNTNEKGFYKF